MGIAVVSPPEASVDALGRHVAKAAAGARHRDPVRALEGLPTSAALRMAAPHPVFNLDVSAVVRGGGFETCRMTAWNYLVLAGERVEATVGYAATHRDEPVSGFHVGGRRAAAAFAQAIGLAERSPRIGRGDFVLAAMRLPALQAGALWLRHVDGMGYRDGFVPIAGPCEAFAVGPLLDGRRWMQQLLRARQRMQANRSPDDGFAGGQR